MRWLAALLILLILLAGFFWIFQIQPFANSGNSHGHSPISLHRNACGSPPKEHSSNQDANSGPTNCQPKNSPANEPENTPEQTEPEQHVNDGAAREAIVSSLSTLKIAATLGTQRPWFAGGRVRALAYSPDATILACAADTTGLTLWDVGSGQLTGMLDQRDTTTTALLFSPDGTKLVAGGNRTTLVEWDLTTLKPAKTFDRKQYTTSLAITETGLLIAAGTGRLVSIWQYPSWAEERSIATCYDIRDIAPNAQGLYIAGGDVHSTTEADGSELKNWSLSGKELKRFEASDNYHGVRRITSGDDVMFAGWANGKVARIDLTTNRQSWSVQPAESAVLGLAWSQRANAVLCVYADGHVIQLAPQDGQILNTTTLHVDRITAAASSPNSAKFAAGTSAGQIIAWDANETPAIPQRVLGAHYTAISALAANDAGDTLISADVDGHVIAWNPILQTHTRSLTLKSPANSVAVLAREPIALLGLANGQVHCWQYQTGEVTQIFQASPSSILFVARTTTDQILTIDEQRQLRMWERSFASQLANVTLPGFPRAISVDNDTLAVICSLGQTIFLQLPNLTELGRLTTSSTGIRQIGLFKQGTTLIAPLSGKDYDVGIWATTSRQLMHTLLAHTTTVTNAVTNSKGTRAITLDDTGQAVLWNIDNRIATAATTTHPAALFAFVPESEFIAVGDTSGTIILLREPQRTGD